MISPQALVLTFQVVEEQCIFVHFRSDHRREQMELVRQRAERVVLKKPVAGSRHTHWDDDDRQLGPHLMRHSILREQLACD